MGLTAGTYNGTITITATNATNSPVSVPVTLTVSAPPSTPSLNSPFNGATNVSYTPTLYWGNVPSATSYDVEVCSDSSCSSAISLANVANSQWTVSPALAQGTKYWWHVRANNSCGSSQWSNIWSFTTICSLPVKPVLSSPQNGATGVSTSPTLHWGDVSGATSYRVQICTDSSCLSIARSATPTDSEWTVTPPLSPVKPPYYWRVKAVNACGSSSWSNIRSFTTACPTLDVPSLISPSHGTIGVPVSPTLDWNDVSGATSYRVQVCIDVSCSYVVVSALTTSSQLISPALIPTTTYYWRVKAKNTCGSSAWSEVRSFKTKPTITVVSPNGSPTPESWQAGTNQTVQWTYTGKPGQNVKIELFKSGVLNKTITLSTPIGTAGTGSFPWSIKVTQAPGCDYKIKITSTTNINVGDKSDKPFCIVQ